MTWLLDYLFQTCLVIISPLQTNGKDNVYLLLLGRFRMEEGGRDEEVASSEEKAELTAGVQKSIPNLWPKRLKNHTVGYAHTSIALIREYPHPPSGM